MQPGNLRKGASTALIYVTKKRAATQKGVAARFLYNFPISK